MGPNIYFFWFYLYFLLTIVSAIVPATPKKSDNALRLKNKPCVCVKSNSDLANVPEMLDPKKKGLDRLVIFAYQTPSGIIYTYIPNKDKQLTIPDLPYESNDSLDIDDAKELLKTVFLNHNHLSTPRSIWKDLPEYEYDIIATEPFEGNEDIDINKILKNDRIIWPNPAINHIKHDISVPNEIIPVQKDDDDSNTEKIIEYVFDDELIQPKENIVKVPVPNKSKRVYFPHLPKQNNLVDWIKQKKNIDSGKTAQQAIETILSHEKRKPDSNFDNWFITKIKDMDLSTKQPINFKTLHDDILTALKHHGMGVSKNGERNILNMENINLRRVLISDLSVHDKVRANPDGSIILPKKPSQYMEALLISLLDTNKIIGVVPLGETIVQNNLNSGDLPLINVQRPSIKIKQKIKLPDFSSVKSDTITNGLESENPLHYFFNNIRVKNIADVKSDNDINDSVPIVLKPLHSDIRLPIKNMPSNKIVPMTDEDIESYLKILKVKQNEKHAAQDTQTEFEAKGNEVLTQKVDKIPMDSLLSHIFGKVKDVVSAAGEILDPNGPGIRIIGGSSATGSGAPINNRGKRSVPRH